MSCKFFRNRLLTEDWSLITHNNLINILRTVR